MPAPVPIEFATGLGPLAELALAAGAAQGRRRDFERQQNADLSFLRDEMSRRQRQNETEAQFRLQQAAQFDQKDMASRQTFALQKAARQQRDTAAIRTPTVATGSPSPLRRALDSATGPPMVRLDQPAGRASIQTRRGTFTTQPDGSVVRESPTHGQELVDPITGELNMSLLPDELRDPASLTRDRALAGGTRFVRAGRGGPDEVTMSVAQQLQILAAAKTIPPADRSLLEQAVRAGGLTTNQLLNNIEERTPSATDERKIDGLSIRDRQLEIQRLRRRRLSFNEYNDPEKTQRGLVDQSIAEEQENITRQNIVGAAPQLSGRSLANPNPSETGTVIDQATAMQFLQRAGGDPDVARMLAREAGFEIPQM